MFLKTVLRSFLLLAALTVSSLQFVAFSFNSHKIIVTLLEVLKEKKQKLMQTAWNYMNDSLRTEVFVRYDPETIACGCIFLSARVLQIPLPNKPAWYLIFGVAEQDILDICQIILSVYIRKKPDAENLEKIVEELRKTHQEAKLKAKGLSAAANVMANFSPASQSCSPRNGKSPSDVKKEKTDLKHNDISPKSNKDTNHKKRRSRSPAEDSYLSPESKRHAGGDNKSSSSGASNSSQSPSGRRKTKALPRGFKFKESQRSRSRTPTAKSVSKKSKHRSSHKRKKSNSLSPGSSPSQHSSKKNYSKSKHAEKVHRARSRSKSKSHERNHHSSSNSIHEKSSHKSRKDRVRENHHSSKEKKRR